MCETPVSDPQRLSEMGKVGEFISRRTVCTPSMNNRRVICLSQARNSLAKQGTKHMCNISCLRKSQGQRTRADEPRTSQTPFVPEHDKPVRPATQSKPNTHLGDPPTPRPPRDTSAPPSLRGPRVPGAAALLRTRRARSAARSSLGL